MRLMDADLDRLLHYGAVKLEITAGIPTWEAAPSSRHQSMVYRIHLHKGVGGRWH